MAQACEAACNNNHIGYDQSQRNTLNQQAQLVGYDWPGSRPTASATVAA